MNANKKEQREGISAYQRSLAVKKPLASCALRGESLLCELPGAAVAGPAPGAVWSATESPFEAAGERDIVER